MIGLMQKAALWPNGFVALAFSKIQGCYIRAPLAYRARVLPANCLLFSACT